MLFSLALATANGAPNCSASHLDADFWEIDRSLPCARPPFFSQVLPILLQATSLPLLPLPLSLIFLLFSLVDCQLFSRHTQPPRRITLLITYYSFFDTRPPANANRTLQIRCDFYLQSNSWGLRIDSSTNNLYSYRHESYNLKTRHCCSLMSIKFTYEVEQEDQRGFSTCLAVKN